MLGEVEFMSVSFSWANIAGVKGKIREMTRRSIGARLRESDPKEKGIPVEMELTFKS